MSESGAPGRDDTHPSRIDTIIQELGIPTVTYWTHAFRELPRDRVGVVKVSGKLLEPEPLAQLADEMAYLARAGLFLPLVFGGGKQYNDIPGYNGAPKVNGLRVTSADLMKQILEIARENQQRICEALQRAGILADAIPLEALVAERHGFEMNERGERVDTGYVGDVASIDTYVIRDALSHGAIPVVAHVGFDGADYLNINATPVATELVRSLRALKLLLLGDSPVYDQKGRVIPTLSRRDVRRLIAEGVINRGMVTNCTTALDLLAHLGPGHAVQITSLKERNGDGGQNSGALASTGLLEELVGSGTGTMFVEPSNVSTYSLGPALERIGEKVIRTIINQAFASQRKRLFGEYFNLIKAHYPTVYVDDLQAGVAIVYPLPREERVAYLCKLAVLPAYEGIGIGKTLMDHVLRQQRAKQNAVVWRTSSDNTRALAFYDDLLTRLPSDIPQSKHVLPTTSEGHTYTVYNVGVPARHQRVVAYRVAHLPPSFLDLRHTDSSS